MPSKFRPKPKNIKIITTSLPIFDPDSYKILFSYIYDHPTHPFLCERTISKESLIKLLYPNEEKFGALCIQLLSPDTLLVADTIINGTPIKSIRLDAKKAFQLSKRNKAKQNIQEVMQFLSFIMNEFNSTLVYRGEPTLFGLATTKRFSQPLPKIFRKDSSENFMHADQEAFLFNKFQHRFYEPSFNTSFQWLADMQHFGMPTRLLDVTSNYLIALYFACQEDNYDGALFSYHISCLYIKLLEDFIRDFWCDMAPLANIAQLKPFLERKLTEHIRIKPEFPPIVSGIREIRKITDKDRWIKEIIKVADVPDSSKNDLDDFIKSNLNNLFEMIFDVYYHCPLHLSPPTYLNQRIAQQSGEFLLFPGKICLGETALVNPLTLKAHTLHDTQFTPTFIPSEWKRKIRQILREKFNVDEGTIYPDKEHIVKSILTTCNRFV